MKSLIPGGDESFSLSWSCETSQYRCYAFLYGFIIICCENWLFMMAIIYLAWSPQSNKMNDKFWQVYGLTCLPVLIMFRNYTRYTASLTLEVSCMNCEYVKEHNWCPLIPFSARRLTEVSLNSCTVHSAQRYTWSSVHCMGRVWRGGRYIKTKGWPSLIPRPFPPPVFDCSSNNGGGRPGRFGHVWWCRQRVDKQGADRDHCTCVTLQTPRWSASSLPNNELYWECYSPQSLDKNFQEGPWDSLLGTAPMCLPIIMSHYRACDKISQAFSSFICIL